MKILAWYWQGIGSPRAVRHLSKLLTSTLPEIIFLSENKASSSRIRKILHQLNWNCFHCVDVVGLSGGLCLF
uniref:Uncharacterized protein n=1 Tax=Nelumbo nucifera TaxID=4432 RepID=A0A822Z6V5_NELNU|nr:TPA_asm: hypothetical protein HUJ06_014636 [Nelumbo nucifera]